MCDYASDGVCQDGGPGTINAVYSDCDLGSDCADCGPRNGASDDASSVVEPPPAPPHEPAGSYVTIFVGVLVVVIGGTLCFVYSRDRASNNWPALPKEVGVVVTEADVEMETL